MSATFTLIIGRKSLEKALAIVKRVAPTKAPKPSLSGALLQVKRGRVTLSATNLEHSVTITLEHFGLLGDLSARVLLDIPKATALVKGAEGETIELNGVADDCAKIGKADITSAYSAEHYPVLPARNAESSIGIDAKELLRAIDRTAFACDQDSTRYALGGALLEFKPDDSGSGWGDVALVATDGKRLAKQVTRGYVNRNSPGAEFDPSAEVSTSALPTHVRPVLPLAVLKIIGPLAKSADKHDEAWFSFTPGEPEHKTSDRYDGPKPGTLFVRLGNVDVYTRLADGRFPRYEDCFPPEPNATVHIPDHTAIGDAMKQAKPFRPEGHNGVDIVTGGNLGSGVFGVYVPHGRETLFSAEVPAQCSGGVVGMTIDPTFLADAMRGLGTKAVALTMEFVDDKSPLAIKTADGWHYLAMPLTRDWDAKPENLPAYWPGAKAEVAAQDEPATETAEPETTPEGSEVFGADSADSPEPMEPMEPIEPLSPASVPAPIPSGVSRCHPPAVEIIGDIVPPEPAGESPKDACDRYRAEWHKDHPRAPKGPEKPAGEVEPTPGPDDSSAPKGKPRMRKGVISRDYWRNDGVTIYKLASGAFVRRAHRKDSQTDGKTYGAFAPVFGPDRNHVKLGVTDTLSAALGLAEGWDAPKDGTEAKDATTATPEPSNRILSLPGPRPMLALPAPKVPAVPAPCCSPDEPTPCAACLTSPTEGQSPDAVFESHPLPRRIFEPAEMVLAPAPVSAALSLTIGDRSYGLMILSGPVYRLDYRDKVYDVSPDGASLAGATCSCPDFTYRRAGLDSLGCRHIRALRECRLLAPVQNFPAPPKDGGGNDPDRAPDFSEPSTVTVAQAPVLSPVLSLALMGFPICGGSPEADDPRLEVLGDAAQEEAEATAARMLAEDGDDSTGWAECWIDGGDDSPEPQPLAPIDYGDLSRDATIKRIRAALKKRSGKSWSVTGGRGTAYGWIEIDAPPRRRTWRDYQTTSTEPPTPGAIYRGASNVTPPRYVQAGAEDPITSPADDPWVREAIQEGHTVHYNWEAEDPSYEFGHTSPADRIELGKLLGLGRAVHCQGHGIAASNGHYREYIDRAEGRTPSVYGERYWD